MLMSQKFAGKNLLNGLFMLIAVVSTLISLPAEAGRKTSTSTVLAITSQPVDTTINEGDSISFSVATNKRRGVAYTWLKDGSVVGTNSKTLSISAATSSNAGIYSCRATDGHTTVTCNNFKLTVNAAAPVTPVSDLKLNSQPSSTTLYEGGSVTFSMNVSSSLVVAYTWFKNGTAIGSGSSLTISNVTLSNAGTYSCEVTDAIQTIACNAFTLTVNQIVRITQQPISQMLNEGASASLGVTATGTAPITYQWYYNGSAISGATSNQYALNSTTIADSGKYYCLVKNPGSSATSSTATLSITAVAKTGSAVISWAAPSTRADGSTLSSTDISGYDLYYSADSAASLAKLTSLSASELSIVVNDLAMGTHYFALATKDSNGLQSALSATISVTIQ